MRSLLLVAALLLAGCAASTDAVKVGPNRYQIAADASQPRGGAAGAQRIATERAAVTCGAKKMQVDVLSVETGKVLPFAGTATVTFQCVPITEVPSARASHPQSPEEAEISRLEEEYNAAYATNDLDHYFSYYGDDLVTIFYNARSTLPEYRKVWTDDVRSGKLAVVSADISDMVVRVSPKGDSAIASYQLQVRNRHAGGKVTDEHAFETDVWFRRAGDWKLVHAQYSLAVPPPE